MRNLKLFFILTAVSLLASGCRVNSAPQRSSSIDSSYTNRPRPTDSTPASQSDTLPALSTAAHNPTDSRPLIVCFGDSLTAGFGTEPGQSYPDYLQSMLDAHGYHYRVVNLGVSGNTTKDGVERVPHVIALHPAVVIVEFGGNDGLRGVPISDFRANLDNIVSTVKSSGARILIAGITLPPDYGPDYIKQFNETYVMLANKYKAPMLPFLLQNVYGIPGLMQHDNTHATAAGNKIVAANVLPLVTPLLKK